MRVKLCARSMGWALTLALGVALSGALPAVGQTLTTGAISGLVTDPSGAVIVGAAITATNLDNGAVRGTKSSAAGTYTLSQLMPGRYQVAVTARGFEPLKQGPISVAVSQTETLNLSVKVGEASQTVEVTGQAPLIETSNPNTTSTVTTAIIDTFPNPGGDLTYEAQVAPGAVMTTNGSYGNVEFNGLMATSNNFTIDGVDDNDPFLNLNNSGATNLSLGLNSISEFTVNTLSYSVDQGRQAAAQINSVSKAGTNHMHGNLYELWNGSSMNSTDFFINANPNGGTKPFSNVNEFGGSLGGALRQNKLFYFLDLEGTRIALPAVATLDAPTPAFQAFVLANLGNGATTYDNDFGMSLPNDAAAIPVYQKAFGLFHNTSGTPTPTPFCPLVAGGAQIPYDFTQPFTGTTPPDGNGCLNTSTIPLNNHTQETYAVYRIDYNLSDTDQFWGKFTQDTGVQATYTDPLNPVFNADSYQPARTGTANWSHTFGPTLINDLTGGFSWYSAIFAPQSYSGALAAFPITWDTYDENGNTLFNTFGGADNAWPQGRNVTQYNVIDNLSWTRGSHSLKFGENLRRVLISDHDLTGDALSPLAQSTFFEFMAGAVYNWHQRFPVTTSEPINIANLDMYAMDTWQATPTLTFTYGVRATWNNDPVNPHNLFSRLTGSFFSIDHSVTTPTSDAILAGQTLMLPSTPLIIWQPRAAFAWQFTPKTVLRGGFGVFSDLFPADLADSLIGNPPYRNDFHTGIEFGEPFEVTPGEGAGSSARDAAEAMNALVSQAFTSGAPSCAAPNAPANCYPVSGVTALPDKEMKYPYALEYSFGIQRQFGNTLSLTAQWVGTGSRQNEYTVGANGYERACAGCFAPWPFGAPPDQRFGSVTQYETGENSNYNGLQITAVKRMGHGITFRGNYTWSHCLDNMGNPWLGAAGMPYANCGSDVRHVFNGSYTYDLPFHASNAFLGQAVNGWQISGSVFLQTGLPFSVTSASSRRLVNTSGTLYANLVPGQSVYAENQVLSAPDGTPLTQPDTVQWLNPYAFASTVDPAAGTCTGGNSPQNCVSGDSPRNGFRGPGYLWSDLFLTKAFQVTEKLKLQVSGQFYNFLNHPNFAVPGSTAGLGAEDSSLTGAFAITSLASPPTGLLGSGLGGDNAVRMIALQGKLVF